MDIFSTIVVKVIPLFFAIVLHEIAHGVAAYLLGDDTAKNEGRFKLYTHFDLFGSFLIPLGLYLINSPFLMGYAKPVPVDPRKFKDPLNDMALVAIAGPLMNILMAVLGALILKNIHVSFSEIIVQMFMAFVVINLALFFFNMIPIPPLDGSRIIAAVIPKNWIEKYYMVEPFGIIIIISLEILSNQLSKIVGCDIGLFHTLIQKPVMGMLEFLIS